MEPRDKLLLLLALAGAGYATYRNWDTIKTKLSLDDFAPGKIKAIDLAKKDMSLDGNQTNSMVLHGRQRNREIEVAAEPWEATRLDDNRFLVVASFREDGRPRSHRFEVNIATGAVTLLPEAAPSPR